MNIGIYGGSFNPIHYGHIGLATWIVENTDLDEVWLMVSPNNPLKDSSILADEQTRLEQAKKAIEPLRQKLADNNKQIIVSDFEFALPRPNFTANTLRQLLASYPDHQFTLIIGEDNLSIFSQWREHEYILNNFRIFVYPRRGCAAYQQPAAKDLQILEDAPYFDISSTELRKNLHI